MILEFHPKILFASDIDAGKTKLFSLAKKNHNTFTKNNIKNSVGKDVL